MLLQPCAVTQAPLNTGLDCQVKMSSPALLIMVPATAKWLASDEAGDFLAYIAARCHDTPNKRWFPLFGNAAPIRTVTDGKESDVTVTYDDGSISFIRNGTITRTFLTNKGGLALAQAFLSFNKFHKYSFIEIDKFNNVLRKQNADGSFSGVPLNVSYSPTPENATLKTEFQAGFTLNYRVEDYIQTGTISASDENLLDVMGLIPSQVVDAGSSTTTKLRVGIKTIGTQTDLLALFNPLSGSNPWAVLSNLVVTLAGAVITPTAIAYNGGALELTITGGASGNKYLISGVAASVYYAANIVGYDVIQPVTITIP